MRNVISVGFYKQTDDAEYILKVDEHKITGGEEDVVEYRWVQNLSCRNHLNNIKMVLQRLINTFCSKSSRKCCTELMDLDMQIGKTTVRLRRYHGQIIAQNRLH